MTIIFTRFLILGAPKNSGVMFLSLNDKIRINK